MEQSTEAADDLRYRIRESFGPAMKLGLQDAELYDEPGAQRIEEWVASITSAVFAEVSPELEQLRYERRLLGAARMVLDLVAAGEPHRWEQARREAEDIAQRIVDEIGHPVTDEPALGPNYRAEILRLQAELDALKAAES